LADEVRLKFMQASEQIEKQIESTDLQSREDKISTSSAST